MPADDTDRLDVIQQPYARPVYVERQDGWRGNGSTGYQGPPGRAAVPLMTAVIGLLLGLLLGYQIPRGLGTQEQGPPPEDPAAALAERDARIATLEQELGRVDADRQAAMAAQDAALESRRRALDDREAALNERERALTAGTPLPPPPTEEERGLLGEAADRLRTLLD